MRAATCALCGQRGVHGSPDECLAQLRAAVDAERRRWLVVPEPPPVVEPPAPKLRQRIALYRIDRGAEVQRVRLGVFDRLPDALAAGQRHRKRYPRTRIVIMAYEPNRPWQLPRAEPTGAQVYRRARARSIPGVFPSEAKDA